MTNRSTAADIAVRDIASEQHWVVHAAQARAAGVTEGEIAQRCRSGRWHPLHRGVYLLDPDLYTGGGLPRLTVIAAGLLAAGPHAVAVGQTAVELHGLPTFGGPEVHVAVPGEAARHRQDGLVVHQLRIRPDEVTLAAGLPVTTALRTLADGVCSLRRFDAVALVDAALNRQLLVTEDLPEVSTRIRGRPGCVAGRRHLAQADGRAQSPGETRVRLICRDGQVMPDALQHPVRDQFGSLLGYADLAWLAEMVAAEVDGKGPHAAPEALFRDRFRQNDFATRRWRVIRFTWGDTFRPGYVLATVRATLERRS